jgi:hypothetical protein
MFTTVEKITAYAAEISRENVYKLKSFRVGFIEAGIHQCDVFPLPFAMWRQTRRRTETEKQRRKESKKGSHFHAFSVTAVVYLRVFFFPISDTGEALRIRPSKYRIVLQYQEVFWTRNNSRLQYTTYSDILNSSINRIITKKK